MSALTRTTHRSFLHRMIFCVCGNELKLTDKVKCHIAKHRSWVRNYAGTSPKRTQATGFVIPFMPPVHLQISEQEGLIEIATSGYVKM